MKTVLRSSEFWVAVAGAICQVLVKFNLIPPEMWDKILYPASVYVVGRLTSKCVKATIRP